jgi:PAS domain S-box-containing protein
MDTNDRDTSSYHLFDDLIEGCQIIGFDWRYIYLNKTAEIHNRRPNSELLGQLYTDMWPGIENTYVYKVMKWCLEDRIPKKIENHFIYPDNVEAWFFLSIQPVPQGILILSMDITESKTAEQSLIESEKKFKSVFEASNVGKSITMPTGEINVNKAFCDLTGYSFDELKNRKWQDLTPPEEIDIISKEFNQMLQGIKTSTRLTKRFIKKDGSHIWADLSVVLITDILGNPLYFITTVVDITERMQTEQQIKKLNEELEDRVARRTAQLEAANREMETFTYSVSHDLKAPLRGIDGYSKLLFDSYNDRLDNDARFFLSSIRVSTLRMNQLIDDLLEYSRLDRSKISRETIMIRELTDKLITDCTENLETGNLKLQNLSPDIGLLADRKGLSIALRNLLENAIKFSSVKTDPVVTINTEETANSWIISVTDNGVGFDMAYSQKIFIIFQRLHRVEEFPGTGIGLAMVSKAMQKMQGRAWAESIPGEGSSFYLEIPKI